MRFSNVGYGGHLVFNSTPRLRTNVLVFTANGSDIITVNARGKLFNENTTHTNTITALGEDLEKNLYSGSNDSTVKKFNKDGTHQWNYTNITGEITALFLTPDNEHVFVGSSTGQLAKLSSVDGTEVWRFSPNGSALIKDITISVHGEIYMCSGSTLMKINATDGEVIWSMPGHTATINGITSTIDNEIVSVDNIGVVKRTSASGDVIVSETVHGVSLVSTASDTLGNIHVMGSDGKVMTLTPELSEVSSFNVVGTTFYALKMDHLGRYFIKLDDKVMCVNQLGEPVWSRDSVISGVLHVTKLPVMVAPVIETYEFIELEPPTNLQAF